MEGKAEHSLHNGGTGGGHEEEKCSKQTSQTLPNNANSPVPPVDNISKHISGLWIGEAVPAPSLAQEAPVNPIKWALSLLSPSEPFSVFGAGFFSDAADFNENPVLFFTLRGKWNAGKGTVSFEKIYDTSETLPGTRLSVAYEGKLSYGDDGQPIITGSWLNHFEGTFGSFACRLEETQSWK